MHNPPLERCNRVIIQQYITSTLYISGNYQCACLPRGRTLHLPCIQLYTYVNQQHTMYFICVAMFCFVHNCKWFNVNGKVYTCGYRTPLCMSYVNVMHIPRMTTAIQVWYLYYARYVFCCCELRTPTNTYRKVCSMVSAHHIHSIRFF